MRLNKKNIKHDSTTLAIILGFIGFMALIIWGTRYHQKITIVILIIASVLWFMLVGLNVVIKRYIESDSV